MGLNYSHNLAERQRNRARQVSRRSALVAFVAISAQGLFSLRADLWKRISVFLTALLLTGMIFGGVSVLYTLGVLPPAVYMILDLRTTEKYNQSPITDADLMRQTHKLILGTQGSGVQEYLVDSGLFGVWQTHDVAAHPDALSDNQIRQVVSDPNGLVVVQENGALARANMDLTQWSMLTGSQGFAPAMNADQITLSRTSQDGRLLLVGTRQNGLGLYDTERHDWVPQNKLPAALRDGAVHDLRELGDIFWIATSKGISALQVNRPAGLPVQVVENAALSFSSAPVKLLENSADGKTVFGITEAGGLLLLDLKNAKPWTRMIGDGGFASKYGQPLDQQITDVLIWQNALWVASNASGLGRYDIKLHDWQTFTANAGLPANVSNSIARLAATDQALYLATQSGIVRLSASTTSAPYKSELIANTEQSTPVSLTSDGTHILAVLEKNGRRSACAIYPASPNCERLLGPSRNLVRTDEQIRAVTIYQNNSWIASQSGVWQYLTSSRTWVNQTSGLPDFTDATAVEFYPTQNALWLRASFKLSPLVFVNQGGAWKNVDGPWSSTAQIAFNSNGVWLLMQNGSLLNLTPGAAKTEFYRPLAAPAKIAEWDSLAVTGKVAHLVHDGKLFSYDIALHNWASGPADQKIKELSADANGTLYFSTTDFGLTQYNPSARTSEKPIPDAASDATRLTDGAQFSSALRQDNRILLGGAGANSGILFEYSLSMRRLRELQVFADSEIVQLRGTSGAPYLLTHNLRKAIPECAAKLPQLEETQWGQLYGWAGATFQPIQGAADIVQLAASGNAVFARNACGEILEIQKNSVSRPYFQGKFTQSGKITGIIKLPDGRILISQDASPYLQWFDPARQLWQNIPFAVKVRQLALYANTAFILAESGLYQFNPADATTRVIYGGATTSLLATSDSGLALLANGITPGSKNVVRCFMQNGVVTQKTVLTYSARASKSVQFALMNDDSLTTISPAGSVDRYTFKTHAWQKTATIELPQENKQLAALPGTLWWYDPRTPNKIQKLTAAGDVGNLPFAYPGQEKTPQILRMKPVQQNLYIETDLGWLVLEAGKNVFARPDWWSPEFLYARLSGDPAPPTELSNAKYKATLKNGLMSLQMGAASLNLSETGWFEHDQPSAIALDETNLYLFSNGVITQLNSATSAETLIDTRANPTGPVDAAASDGKSLHILTGALAYQSGDGGKTWQSEPLSASIITGQKTVYEEKDSGRVWQSSAMEGSVRNPNLSTRTHELLVEKDQIWLQTGDLSWRIDPGQNFSLVPETSKSLAVRWPSEGWASGILQGWSWTVTYDRAAKMDTLEIKKGEQYRNRFLRGQFADDMINATAIQGKQLWAGTEAGTWMHLLDAPLGSETDQLIPFNAPSPPAIQAIAFAEGRWYALDRSQQVWEVQAEGGTWQKSSQPRSAIVEYTLNEPGYGQIMAGRLGDVVVNAEVVHPNNAFSFDVIASIAAFDDTLWLAAGDQAIQTSASATEILYRQHLNAGPSRIQQFTVSQNELWALMGKDGAVLRQGAWVLNPDGANPFSSPAPTLLSTQDLPLTWSIGTDGGIRATFRGQPVQWMNGDFDFDLPKQGALQKDQTVWVETAGGNFQYALNPTAPKMSLLPARATMPALDTRRTVVISPNGFEIQEAAAAANAAFIQFSTLAFPPRRVLLDNGKFPFDQVNGVAVLPESVGLATPGGLLMVNLLEPATLAKQWETFQPAQGNVTAIHWQANRLSIQLGSTGLEIAPPPTSGPWSWSQLGETDLFLPIDAAYVENRWVTQPHRAGAPHLSMVIQNKAIPMDQMFLPDGRFTFDFAQVVLRSGEAEAVQIKTGCTAWPRWRIDSNNRLIPDLRDAFQVEDDPGAAQPMPQLNPAEMAALDELPAFLYPRAPLKIRKFLPIRSSAFFAISENQFVQVDIDRLRTSMYWGGILREIVFTKIKDFPANFK